MSPPHAVGPPAEVVVGLDVGTTAAKAVAFGVGAPWRTMALREYPLLTPQPGEQVQDPGQVAAGVLQALAAVTAAASPAGVVAVSVSTAMHGLIGLDADLVPLTPLLTWADARSVPQARRLRQSDLAAALYRAGGSPIHPMTPLTKLMWFGETDPRLAGRVHHWVGLKDFILLTLTGQLVTEMSSAAGTALWSIATRDWNPAALELAGIRAEQLPPILPTTARLSLSTAGAAASGLPPGTPVVVGAADGPLGNLGTGAMRPGVAGLSIGTSGAIRMALPAPALDPDGRLFCYPLTEHWWVVGGAVSNGGEVVRWAGRIFGADLETATAPATSGTGLSADGRSADAALLGLAEAVPAGSDGLLMLPYLLAERAPLWDPELTGAFLGIRHEHTRGHFVRAAVEGVALQLAAITQRLDRLAPVTGVRATGGVFRSPLWRHVVAAALGRPLVLTSGTEGTALGAAALGLYALGRADDLEAAAAGLRIAEPESTVAADEADVAAYRRLAASVPAMLRAYADVTAMFAALA